VTAQNLIQSKSSRIGDAIQPKSAALQTTTSMACSAANLQPNDQMQAHHLIPVGSVRHRHQPSYAKASAYARRASADRSEGIPLRTGEGCKFCEARNAQSRLAEPESADMIA
jgi:hypothetical protein